MEKVKLLIIGAGPGGYVAAIRAAQLGLEPVVIEKADLGGTCLNWGCIPTKALIAAAETFENISHSDAFGITATATFDWTKVVAHAKNAVTKNRAGVQYLFKKNKVRLVTATAKFTGRKTVIAGETEFEAENIIIATGSKVRDVAGFPVDGKNIISSDHALFQEKLPKSIAIIGGGVIGVEMAYICHSFGVEVTIIEAMNSIIPFEDADISKELTKEFKKKKMKIHTGVFVEKVEKVNDLMVITLNNGTTVEAAQVLSSVGRSPNLDGLDIEKGGVVLNEKGFIKTDELFKTNVEGVFAIGDCIPTPMLAHTAEHEGIVAVEQIAGMKVHKIDYLLNPGCIYCLPSIGSIGYRESTAIEKGIKIKTGKFPFSANGKAVASNHTTGFVKVIIEEESHKIIGAHIIGYGATDLISEFILAMKLGATAEDIVESIHPHPTLCEASLEAVLNSLGRTIHI
ncbi:MAG: dihydrolipoyl dehydrogenase [bacterium]|jgi:dihydrolipoamide dehydrogenase|nr:dihydrolipoyl dehydrogenase [bacterium]